MTDERTRPPGHTCPAIDEVGRKLKHLHRLTKRDRVDRSGLADRLLAEGLEALERVRSENTQMRAAHAEARKELKQRSEDDNE